MISLAKAVVLGIKTHAVGVTWLEVQIRGEQAGAVAFEEFIGPIGIGDEVLLNTTAADLQLGSGGWHIVVSKISDPALSTVKKNRGHIMKLRYTPLQYACLAVEEPDSPYHDAMKEYADLAHLPVVAASLHSQVAPAVLGILKANPKARIVYIMTDGAALPAKFSRLIDWLRQEDLVKAVITCGNAFGGDLEAVNIYSALQAAKIVAKADAVIVAMGPGITGTSTALGHMGMEQGMTVNAAASLGCTPIATARLSFADKRKRHQGVSHHSLSALQIAALVTGVLPLPELTGDKKSLVDEQLAALAARGWQTPTYDSAFILPALEALTLKVTTMGRGPRDDPEFFMAAAAAGLCAGEKVANARGGGN